MDLLGGGLQVHLLEERVVLRVLGGSRAVLLLEDAGILALHRVAVGVVAAVVLDRVDEEQAQHLDALRPQALFLVQMLLDGAADHRAAGRQSLSTSPKACPGCRNCSPPGTRSSMNSLPFCDADLADAAVGVDGAPGGLLEVVAVLHGDFLALHAAGASARPARPWR